MTVLGAVSSGQAMVVRASALADKSMIGSLDDVQFYETLTAFGGGGAIIHDKVVVIDPMDPQDCVVAFGSHNLGYKASYCNDENPLALAYAALVGLLRGLAISPICGR